MVLKVRGFVENAINKIVDGHCEWDALTFVPTAACSQIDYIEG